MIQCRTILNAVVLSIVVLLVLVTGIDAKSDEFFIPQRQSMDSWLGEDSRSTTIADEPNQQQTYDTRGVLSKSPVLAQSTDEWIGRFFLVDVEPQRVRYPFIPLNRSTDGWIDRYVSVHVEQVRNILNPFRDLEQDSSIGLMDLDVVDRRRGRSGLAMSIGTGVSIALTAAGTVPVMALAGGIASSLTAATVIDYFPATHYRRGVPIQIHEPFANKFKRRVIAGVAGGGVGLMTGNFGLGLLTGLVTLEILERRAYHSLRRFELPGKNFPTLIDPYSPQYDHNPNAAPISDIFHIDEKGFVFIIKDGDLDDFPKPPPPQTDKSNDPPKTWHLYVR